MKLNILILGNSIPHLHAHIVPRYEDDPDGGGHPRLMMAEHRWRQLDDDVYLSEIDALRSLLAN